MATKMVSALVLLFIIGFVPPCAWAGPRLLSDNELDAVYAQGIFVNIDLHIAFPGSASFSLPGNQLSLPDKVGASLGDIGAQRPSTMPANGGSGANGALPPGLNSIGPGPNGLVISASHAAISMSVNVLVANNSTIGGNVIQNSTSYPTNLIFSIATFSP
jgi:hypothetical protein